LVGAFSTPADLGIVPPLWKRMADLVAGAERVGLVRPSGVAVRGARIAVADPGAALVHLYDRAEGRSRRVTGCREGAFGEPVAVAFLGELLLVSDAVAARVEVVRDDGCEAAWTLPTGSRPAGIAVAPAGDRAYVADAGAHRILVYNRAGRIVSSFGRRGFGLGELNYPTWIAVDGTGDVYVTDALNFRVQIFDAAGAPRGRFGVHGDASGQLAAPKGIGVGSGGEIYLVDALFDAVQVFDRDGDYLMVFGERGRGPGRFWLPSGLAVDGERIYVADSYNQRIQIFRILEGAG
jgi:DNA-binding beta-propeller fold protein YncE